ncbi:MAG: FHA domain-containing protein [Planctomycetes bacterium]|nr:FHA domain-containing protein [Planctomycetota bacterium]
MVHRRLVFLGPRGSGEALRYEGRLLQGGESLPVVRTRSPWSPSAAAERVIVGAHPARADVLLEGAGIHPEHVRLYVPRAGGPADFLAIHPASTRVNGKPVEPRDWTRLEGGEEVELGPWRFRYEDEEP